MRLAVMVPCRRLSSAKVEKRLPLTREASFGGQRAMLPELPEKAKLLASSFSDTIPRPPVHKLQFLGKAGKRAHAIFNAAKTANELDRTNECLQTLSTYYKEHQELTVMQINPLLSLDNLQAMVEKIGRDLGVTELVLKNWKELAAEKRLKFVVPISAFFAQLLAEERHQVHALVVSAQELSSSQVSAIEVKMKSVLKPGEHLVITKQIDPSILGGFIWRIGSTQQDLSVRTHIDQFQRHLEQHFTPPTDSRTIKGIASNKA